MSKERPSVMEAVILHTVGLGSRPISQVVNLIVADWCTDTPVEGIARATIERMIDQGRLLLDVDMCLEVAAN